LSEEYIYTDRVIQLPKNKRNTSRGFFSFEISKTYHVDPCFAKKNGGFTLVELLIVMAIIAVLVGLAIAGITYANMQSRNNQRLAALNNVDRALVAFYDENRYFPSSNGNTFDNVLEDHIEDYMEGSWESPASTVFYYRTDARNIVYIVCVSLEELGGNRSYTCKGSGLGTPNGNWPQDSDEINCEGIHDPVDCGSGPVYWDANSQIWVHGVP
jgi:prepilin-type N-terminal cleavage/methylation domain-containing protein